ncbi:hypothetical protein C9994_00715 [Marivirga lumbricoides]|uniref:Uncharacterized protein n=1 Tax=Marivirga lumbricoides TaxID=1046115 RepID=A0A2T4DVQ1_9BACT|nr:hypothetical protein C9994_00715 [Marivirga lumbricoides]
MNGYNILVQSKISELSKYGYVNNFSFENGRLSVEVEEGDVTVVKYYVPEQISVETEYYFEENGSAVVSFMTNDGILGYAVDQADSIGEYPLINFFDSVDDD